MLHRHRSSFFVFQLYRVPGDFRMLHIDAYVPAFACICIVEHKSYWACTPLADAVIQLTIPETELCDNLGTVQS